MKTTYNFNKKWALIALSVIALIFFNAAFVEVRSQTPNNDANSKSLDPTQVHGIPEDKNAVNFGRETSQIPTFYQMLEVNLNAGESSLSGDSRSLAPSIVNGSGTLKGMKDVFSNVRVFLPCNQDFFHNGFNPEPHSQNDTRPASEQIPKGNLGGNSNLLFLVNVSDNTATTQNYDPVRKGASKFIYPEISNGAVALKERPANAYFNQYENYMNINYNHIKAIYDYYKNAVPGFNGIHATLNVIGGQFREDPNAHNYPNGWFSASEWGGDADKNSPNGNNTLQSSAGLYAIQLNAKAYAMMFARVYAPKKSDCASCNRLVDVLDVGNEPYAYKDPHIYQAILQGFIEGMDTYYASDATNRIKLITAAFQANHDETTPTPFGSLYNYLQTRIRSDQRSKLSGVNTHPYSADLSAGEKLLAYPEKATNNLAKSSTFLYTRNACRWVMDNPLATSDLYASEFGWDSDAATCPNNAYVGAIPQAVYTIRNILMMGRYGVHRASYYEAYDDPYAGCGYAYQSSGVWGAENKGLKAKYIFNALDNFMSRAGALKFHCAPAVIDDAQTPNEQDGGVYAYILEDAAQQPKYVVAWLGKDANDMTNSISKVADLINKPGNKRNDIQLALHFDGGAYIPDDSTGVCYQLDGENGKGLALNQFYNKATGNFTLSVVPVLIPIKINKSGNTVCVASFSGRPKDINATALGLGVNITWEPPTFRSTCPGSSVSSNYLPGALFPVGTTKVIYTGTDASGLKTTCTFQVRVNKNINIVVPKVTADADVSVQITGSGTYKSYTFYNFTIVARNEGSVAVQDVRIQFVQPKFSTGIMTAKITAGAYNDYCPGGIACKIWNLPNLAVGASETLILSVFIMDPQGATLTAGANLLSSAPADVNPANDKSTADATATGKAVAAIQGADVALQITGSGGYKKYSPYNFTLTAKNEGTLTAQNVKVQFVQPAFSTGVTVAAASGGEYNNYCAGGAACKTWTIPNLAPGATATLTLSAYILDPQGADLTAGANLLTCNPADVNPANDAGSVVVHSVASLAAVGAGSGGSGNQANPSSRALLSLMGVYPNPVNTMASIEVNLEASGEVELDFMDVLGRTVKREVRNAEAGKQGIVADLGDLQKGVYFLVLFAQDKKTPAVKLLKW